MVIFFKEAIKNWQSIGTVLPSSKCLAHEMTSNINGKDDTSVLEVGSGTGIFSLYILDHFPAIKQLSIIESNEELSGVLQKNIDDVKQRKATMETSIDIFNGCVTDFMPSIKYDYILSSLPFNNMPLAAISQIMSHYKTWLKPLGTLSFYEYSGIRALNLLLMNRNSVTSYNHYLATSVMPNVVSESHVLYNFPPANVYHIKP